MIPLLVSLHDLQASPVRLSGTFAADDLEINGLDPLIQVRAPVRYELEVQKLEKSLLVQGRLAFQLECQCVRCLKAFSLPVELTDLTLSLALDGAEAVPVVADCVDLTPHLREDTLLAFPQHPLCDPECAGLTRPPAPGITAGPASEALTTSSVWAVLNELKL